MTAWCTRCGDEFAPIEGRPPSDDPDDQSNFCSDRCYDEHHDAIDAEACVTAYREARHSGAPAL